MYNNRRKFRSQTSDNMDRWKAEQGRGREKRKIRREKIRRERVRRKKMQMREKVGKSRNTVFFQWFEAPEGRKVGSLKRRVRSQLARWEMKNCTPLWREAHFQVKIYKTPQRRTTFGSCNVEKVHAVVARSTFRSQNAQNTPGPDHFWQLRCRKSARRCGTKHISKSKCTKHTTFGSWDVEKVHAVVARSTFRSQNVKTPGVRTTFGGSDVEKVHAVVAWSTFRSQNVQNTRCSEHFWRLRCRFAWQAHEIVDLVKSAQNMRVLQHFDKRWQAWDICRWSARRRTKDMFMREVGRSGRWFPERGYILEYQKCRFAKRILRSRSTLDRWGRKIAERIGTRVWVQHWSFHYWRKFRRSGSSLMLST